MDLPAAEGTIELPAADLEINIPREGPLSAGDSSDWSEIEYVAEWLRERVDLPDDGSPSPRRLRLRGDAAVLSGRVREVAEASIWAGLAHVELAAFPDGRRGLEIGGVAAASMPAQAPPADAENFRTPLTVHLAHDRVWIGRSAISGVGTDRLADAVAREALVGALLAADRALHPDALSFVLDADDGVPWEDTFRILGLAAAHGYTQSILQGGPDLGADAPSPFGSPTAAPDGMDRPPPNGASVLRPRAVHLSPEGLFRLRSVEPEEVDAAGFAWFWEDCARDPCAIVGKRRLGGPILLGPRPASADPAARFLLGRPVVRADGLTGNTPLPAFDGEFHPLFTDPRPEPSLDAVLAGATGRRASEVALMVPEGDLDKGLIDKQIRAQGRGFDRCIRQAESQHPELRGRVILDFVIDRVGSVAAAEVQAGTVGDASLHGCLQGALADLRFANPEGGGLVRVQYPLVVGG